MNANHRNPMAAVAMFVSIMGTGCVHNPNLDSCRPVGVQSECWTSSRTDKSGVLRHSVVERVTPAEPCDIVELEVLYFDRDGVLIERVLDRQLCQVVEQRTVERYDLQADTFVRQVQADLDHDDAFDVDEVEEARLSPAQRAYALGVVDSLSGPPFAPSRGRGPLRHAVMRMT